MSVGAQDILESMTLAGKHALVVALRKALAARARMRWRKLVHR